MLCPLFEHGFEYLNILIFVGDDGVSAKRQPVILLGDHLHEW